MNQLNKFQVFFNNIWFILHSTEIPHYCLKKLNLLNITCEISNLK